MENFYYSGDYWEFEPNKQWEGAKPPPPEDQLGELEEPADQGTYRRFPAGNMWRRKFAKSGYNTATFTTSLYLPCFAITEQFLPLMHSIDLAFTISPEKVYTMCPSWHPGFLDMKQRFRIKELYLDLTVLKVRFIVVKLHRLTPHPLTTLF